MGRGSWLSLTRHPQLCCQALPEDLGAGDTLLHADVHHRYKRADIQGPHARVFTWGWDRYEDGSWDEQADEEGGQPFPSLFCKLSTATGRKDVFVAVMSTPASLDWEDEQELCMVPPPSVPAALLAVGAWLSAADFSSSHSRCTWSQPCTTAKGCSAPGWLLHHPELTRVPAHVNELPSCAGCTQRPFDNGLRRPHKGVDGAVGGGAGIHVQQHTAGCPGDGLPQRINHLPDSGRWQGS